MRERSKPEKLSTELIQILKEEEAEAEILAAMDAAAEEGMNITREEAIALLIDQIRQPDKKTA